MNLFKTPNKEDNKLPLPEEHFLRQQEKLFLDMLPSTLPKHVAREPDHARTFTLGDKENNHDTYRVGQITDADTHIFFVLKTQLELERNMEQIKLKLSKRPDFNLIDAFRIFNVNSSGSASINDLVNGLHKMGMSVSVEEMTLFMSRFDKDNDLKLRYSEFCQAFLP